MGTNYYAYVDGVRAWHVGKSSAGWTFQLHVDPDAGLNDLPDIVKKYFDDPTYYIEDEYGDTVSRELVYAIITERSFPHQITEEALRGQGMFAMRGPNNLLRATLGHGCIKHGSGTWDCIVGEFC